MEPAAASLVLPPDDTDADTDPQPPQPSQPRPPSPHALNHAGLLALVASGEFSHQTTLRALRIHPEWLCTLPPEATETPLHAVVRTGNLRLLEMLLAEHPKALDLDARDGQGRTVWEVAMAGESQHPRMGARVEGLRAFEAGAYALCVAGELSDTARQDALVAALTRRLDWVSSRHHKAWSVLHHLVHHGDVPLLERVVGIPGSFAAIKLRARTRDCRRTVVDLARGSPEMARYLKEVLGPMFGLHTLSLDDDDAAAAGGLMGKEDDGEWRQAAAFPRVRAVAAGNVKIVHFIRHAEGTHNEAARRFGEGAYKDWAWEDAELTAAGRAQCLRLHRRLLRSRLMETLDLVVVSPLRRTLATASLAFGEGEGEAGEGNGADHGKNGRFLRPHVPPLVAVEAIRETTGLDPCNKRSPLSALRAQFPHVDFSEVRREEDALFDPERWESEEDMADRGHYFLWWLGRRPERNIAVVSHGSFLVTFFERVLEAPETMRHWWENTEVRSLAVHFPPSTTNEASIPSDLAALGHGGCNEDEDEV